MMNFATEFDIARAVIQSLLYRQYLSGLLVNTGLDLDALVLSSKYRLVEAKRFFK
jgi:hypothetical protein